MEECGYIASGVAGRRYGGLSNEATPASQSSPKFSGCAAVVTNAGRSSGGNVTDLVRRRTAMSNTKRQVTVPLLTLARMTTTNGSSLFKLISSAPK